MQTATPECLPTPFQNPLFFPSSASNLALNPITYPRASLFLSGWFLVRTTPPLRLGHCPYSGCGAAVLRLARHPSRGDREGRRGLGPSLPTPDSILVLGLMLANAIGLHPF
eukprot:4417385-Pleurochrysis_carterae.AAC.5